MIANAGNFTRLRLLEIEDDHGVLEFDSESVAKVSNVSKVSLKCRGVKFPFSKLPNLESLEVSNNQFDDFSMTTKLTWLRIVRRSDPLWETSPSHDFQQLAALECLRYLDLDLAIAEDQYAFLSNLTNLENLTIRSLTNTPVLTTGPCLQFINSSKLTSLESSLPLEFAYLTRLTSLQRIINHQKISEGEEEISTKFPNVTELDTRRVMTAKYYPSLKRLTVFNSVSPEEFQVLSSLSLLEALYLSTIDNSTLQIIGRLTKLTQLTVQFGNATTYDIDALTNLTALKILQCNRQLSKYDVNCSGLLPLLRILTNLEELDLFQIDDETVKLLEDLPNLKRLVYRADHGQFDESKLSNLTNLQTLKRIGSSFPLGQTQHDCKLKFLPYLLHCTSN